MSSSTPEGRALELLQAGRTGEAESALRAILARSPDNAGALNLLGCLYSQTGRRDEGLALIDRSIERDPGNPGFLNNRARVLAEAGRPQAAERDLRRALQLAPGFFAALYQLGSVLRGLGRRDEAIAAFRRAAAVEPANPLASRGLALAFTDAGLELIGLGRGAEALRAFEQAVAADPRNADALNNLGFTLQQVGRLDEAIAHYARAVEARPGYSQAYVNWGNALKDRGDLSGARQRFEEALAHAPAMPEAWNNAASIALDLGDLDAAERGYRRALELRPGFADSIYGSSQVELRRHRFASGWEAHERRFDTTPPLAARRAFAIPPLAAADLGEAHRVAVWMEQGVGDQILFSTLLPQLQEAGLTPVVEVDPRLQGIYRRSLPEIEFTTPQASARAFAGCDRETALGSLPRLFRPDAASFARQPRALLQPDAARVAAMREALGAGRWIGISWRSLQGGSRAALAARKSIALEHFAPLARATGARLLDLQYGDVAAERAQFEARHPGLLVRPQGLDAFDDFEGLLAAIEACERVVTASNVTAHLAGAIGKETTVVFLGAVSPFHYWSPGAGGRSLWYPSVKIATDPSWTRWEEAFEALARRGFR